MSYHLPLRIIDGDQKLGGWRRPGHRRLALEAVPVLRRCEGPAWSLSSF